MGILISVIVIIIFVIIGNLISASSPKEPLIYRDEFGIKKPKFRGKNAKIGSFSDWIDDDFITNHDNYSNMNDEFPIIYHHDVNDPLSPEYALTEMLNNMSSDDDTAYMFADINDGFVDDFGASSVQDDIFTDNSSFLDDSFSDDFSSHDDSWT
ncbi:hypothetical protein Q4503_10110 [Colwellia sp. 6_MG-2023]|uniref:hypothetical protein n=1 Tax=Colwellia sp. 6_MG-2023 TaxID=3062676 RepID=UPI0026E40907|nr:hypothetical protein [Colwellia sp. 6_MG-2023]MDO6488054.1 hypothetical protein [Colwellia sp. 6_MG-2023]